MTRKSAAIVGPMFCLLSLAGCASGGTDGGLDYSELVCPHVGLVEDARTATRFVGEGFAENDYYSRAIISDFNGGCEYSPDKVRLEFDIEFVAELGPAAKRDKKPRTQSYDYFVAVLSPDDRVLVKDVRPIEMEFGRDATLTTETDRVSLKIPLSDPVLGPEYKVTMGFQLSQADLAYNRRNKKRFPGE